MIQVDCQPLYSDGRHYDLQSGHITEDIQFYQELLERFGDPVLELACGTGRISIPLAEKGWAITGLDVSEGMLEQARRKTAEKGVSVEWILADCRTFSLNKSYKLILFPFNSIAHLHDRESIEACFTCVRNHLSEEGYFVIDFFNPRLDILLRDSSRRYPVFTYLDPDGNGTVVVTENNVYDDASQINMIKWYYQFSNREEEIVEELNMRMFFPQELDALLYYNGFSVESRYGNYNRETFQTGSPKHLVVCRRRR